MASTNKTENFELNQWLGSDVPQRVDFNEDNRIIDEALYAHMNDMSLHTTELDKMQNASYAYVGNGAATQVLEMPFEPHGVFVMATNHCPISINGNTKKWYFSVGVKGLVTGNVLINGRNVTVKQGTPSSTNQEVPALNENGELYAIIALRSVAGDEPQE